MTVIYIFMFLCFIRLSAQKSTPADHSYVAAVVEYQVQSNETANLQKYLQLIENAANQNADIIVFPEMTLIKRQSVVVPIYGLLKVYPVPAAHPELYDEVLVSISTAAKQSQIYVVINMQEMMDCRNGGSPGENCPKQKQYRFNTNVVFDRNGAVIDRYRKINLFGEYPRMAALTPDLGVFTTDFGVTFGHFICFDLMFQVPSIQVVQKNNITDVIFPTMWFSELPYLTAVEIQQAYAHTMNVNFLAAGANNVRVGSTGSGIFSGKAGALISLMTGVPTTRLLVAEVPKVPGQVEGTYPGPIYDNPADQDNLLLKTDSSLLSHVSRLLKTGLEEFTLEDKDVYCHFKVRLSQQNGKAVPFYRAFVHDSFNVYAKRRLGTAGCVIVSCKNEDLKSCCYRLNKTEELNIKIEELEIEMTSHRSHYNNTLKCDDVVYYPISLRNNKFPLNPQNYTFRIDQNRHFYTLIDNEITQNDQQFVTYRLNSPQTELLSFGIWGRIYEEDSKEVIYENVEPHAEIQNSLLGGQKEYII
ncbi:vanin-like protein 2 isoform X2 [Maniola hyperantus]|uniref:vanin-like protein 2 isoform X2 n=1 Tax=Aphantopus hyperantus TaxID=2795564 RepID=UPI0015688646|nr:vanin-like protein 2 isoform X2 [Maniola hyperantus]